MKSCFLIVLTSCTLSVSAFAHARWKLDGSTPPRNDSTGLKVSECGGPSVPRTSHPKAFKPGADVLVQWEETINHKGYFIISFSEANDINFTDHVLIANFPDTQDNPIVSNKYHQYSTTIRFPNISCETCTLQLIQVMEDVPGNPTKYFSCSDIRLSTDAAVTSPSATNPVTGVKPTAPTGLKVEKVK